MLPILLVSFVFLDPIPAIDAAALKKEQESAWKDLSNREETVASRALLKLSNRPIETVLFLKEVMKPLKIDEATVKKLTEDLASIDEKVWKPAFETFKYQDPRLAISLQKCFDQAKPGLGRQRMVAVLSDFSANAFAGKNIELRSNGENSHQFIADNFGWWAENKISRLSGFNVGTNKRSWIQAERTIILLEHIGTKDAIVILKSMATGHVEAGPTIAAKQALKLLKAE